MIIWDLRITNCFIQFFPTELNFKVSFFRRSLICIILLILGSSKYPTLLGKIGSGILYLEYDNYTTFGAKRLGLGSIPSSKESSHARKKKVKCSKARFGFYSSSCWVASPGELTAFLESTYNNKRYGEWEHSQIDIPPLYLKEKAIALYSTT